MLGFNGNRKDFSLPLEMTNTADLDQLDWEEI
jgi:hypothetical protein